MMVSTVALETLDSCPLEECDTGGLSFGVFNILLIMRPPPVSPVLVNTLDVPFIVGLTPFIPRLALRGKFKKNYK